MKLPPNLQPWIASLPSRDVRRRAFFTHVFNRLDELGFKLENEDAIDGGYRLEFRKGNSHVVADRYMHFPVMGETPGVALHEDGEEWDCTFTARVPVNVVISAIDTLNPDAE
jgi:hypothetical protein